MLLVLLGLPLLLPALPRLCPTLPATCGGEGLGKFVFPLLPQCAFIVILQTFPFPCLWDACTPVYLPCLPSPLPPTAYPVLLPLVTPTTPLPSAYLTLPHSLAPFIPPTTVTFLPVVVFIPSPFCHSPSPLFPLCGEGEIFPHPHLPLCLYLQENATGGGGRHARHLPFTCMTTLPITPYKSCRDCSKFGRKRRGLITGKAPTLPLPLPHPCHACLLPLMPCLMLYVPFITLPPDPSSHRRGLTHSLPATPPCNRDRTAEGPHTHTCYLTPLPHTHCLVAFVPIASYLLQHAVPSTYLYLPSLLFPIFYFWFVAT